MAPNSRVEVILAKADRQVRAAQSALPTVPGLPPGLSRGQVIELMPWVRSWLRPLQAADAPLPPRDFLRTPFALSLLSLPADGGAPLAKVPRPTRPAAVLRRLARALFAQQVGPRLQQERLMTAVGGGDDDMVRGALQPEALNAYGEQGHLPLTLAALLGRPRVVDLLLKAGASPTGCDVLGNSALHWAAIVEDEPMMQLLLAGGAEKTQENMLGGQAEDHLLAWRAEPAAEPGILCQPLDGPPHTPSSRTSFAARAGFEYLAEPRPGVDFFMQILFNMANPAWTQGVTTQLPGMRLPRQAPRWPRLFMKDFGPPWGWGVCAGEPLAAGTSVTTYVGDLVHAYEMLISLLNWGPSSYECVSMATPSLQASFLTQFDARRSGNLGSRINSAHHPEAANLRLTGGFYRGLPQARFVAQKDIPANAQLSWYYGDGFWQSRGSNRSATPLPAF